jgi:hypothetical protein
MDTDKKLDIVRTLPEFLPVPIYDVPAISNKIPDTNNAKILIQHPEVLDEIIQKYDSPLPIYVDRSMYNCISCMDFGNSFVVTYDECNVVHDEVMSMIYSIDVVIAKNTDLQRLRDHCSLIMKDTDYIIYNGVKYSDTLENIYARIEFEKLDLAPLPVSLICRDLPQIKPVFKPDLKYLPPMCCDTPVNVELYYDQEWISNMKAQFNYVNEYVKNILPTYKLASFVTSWSGASKHECQIRYIWCRNHVIHDCVEFKEFVVDVDDLALWIKQLDNLNTIVENKKILELHKTVHKFVNPETYELYNGIPYGNPRLSLG